MLLVDETSPATSIAPSAEAETGVAAVPTRRVWRARVKAGVRWLPRIVLNGVLIVAVSGVVALTYAPGYVGASNERNFNRGDRGNRSGWFGRSPRPGQPGQPPGQNRPPGR